MFLCVCSSHIISITINAAGVAVAFSFYLTDDFIDTIFAGEASRKGG